MELVLATTRFHEDSAGEVASWPVDEQELHAWAGTNTSFPMAAEQFQQWHADPEVHAFVGHVDGRLVAYGELWADRDENEIEVARVIVRPESRRRGLARTFITALVARAATFDLDSITLRVLPDNQLAIRCYLSAGFVEMPPNEQAIFNSGQPRDYVWFHFRSGDTLPND